MFAGNAAGQYLPPMVVYKSENIYREWVRGGPANTVCECTKCHLMWLFSNQLKSNGRKF